MGNIKCVIAAGGLGTRLKDYRNSPTKMLLEVNGTPMINRQISQLQDWGLEDFIIITNPEFETLTKNVTNKEFTNLNLKYSIQDKPEGISHAFLQAEEHLSEDDITVFILGDNFFEYNPLSGILEIASTGQFVAVSGITAKLYLSAPGLSINLPELF